MTRFVFGVNAQVEVVAENEELARQALERVKVIVGHDRGITALAFPNRHCGLILSEPEPAR